jgi:hypothetical protein
MLAIFNLWLVTMGVNSVNSSLNSTAMFKTVVLIVFCSITIVSVAQVPQFDKMEMLYAQQHYKMVHRKANWLLDKPEFDFSLVPLFYKSLASFQLSQNKYWLVRHENALEEASQGIREIRKSSDGRKVLTAHMHELAALKQDLNSWMEDLKRRDKKEELERLQSAIKGLFDDVPEIDVHVESTSTDLDTASGAPDAFRKDRERIIEYAKKQLGVPYVWAGEDPSGFDCSGFTSYVMKEYGKYVPRRAVDQYNASKKLKEKQVQKGDLVFFNNGSGVSHVGMIVSNRGEPVTMIHASSSKGISIIEIGKSSYWTTRLHGYGTFIY